MFAKNTKYTLAAAFGCLMAVALSTGIAVAQSIGGCNGPGCASTDHINVICEEGVPSQNDMNAVVWHTHLSLPSPDPTDPTAGAASAAFINNVWEDETSFLLTARHVAHSTGGPSYNSTYNSYYRINYHYSDCAGTTIPSYTAFQVQLRVFAQGHVDAGSSVDFGLLHLETPIPTGAKVYYLGWTIDDAQHPFTSGVTMGHPLSDLKKITLFDNVERNKKSDLWTGCITDGTLQVGNSGGPFIDQDHLVRGVAISTGGCSPNPGIQSPILSHFWDFDFYHFLDSTITSSHRLDVHLGRNNPNIETVLPLAGYDFDLEDLVFTDPTVDFGGGFFRTVGDITAENLTVEPGGNLQLRARGSILMNPPFEAKIGSEFLALNEEAPPQQRVGAFDSQPVPSVNALAGSELPQEMPVPALAVDPAYPNPFARETRIRLTIPNDEHVRITIYDLLGRRVAVIMDEYLDAGNVTVVWFGMDVAGNHVAAGTYLYRIEAGEEVETGSVTVVR